jgi:hypothetical protein
MPALRQVRKDDLTTKDTKVSERAQQAAPLQLRDLRAFVVDIFFALFAPFAVKYFGSFRTPCPDPTLTL